MVSWIPSVPQMWKMQFLFETMEIVNVNKSKMALVCVLCAQNTRLGCKTFTPIEMTISTRIKWHEILALHI